MFHVISRDHETDFGASSSGSADIPLQNSIVQFVTELKLAGASPDMLDLTSQARRQLLLSGISGIVCQNANKVKAFQNIIGLKKPETLELACQLFGDVDVQFAVQNVERLMQHFEERSKKQFKFVSRKQSPLSFQKDTPCQPNPLAKWFQIWNCILVLFILFICIKMPLEALGTWPWEMGAVYEVVIEILVRERSLCCYEG